MKTCLKLALILIICISSYTSLKAQDAMILRNRLDTVWVKVLEVGTNELRYKNWPVDESMPVMVERKDRIKRVIFANGTVMRFADNEFVNEENYAGQKRMAIKTEMFAPLSKAFSLTFEKVIEPGKNIEATLGYFGTTDAAYNGTVVGMQAKLGYKFVNQPDYYQSGMRYMHILKGGYIKPELVFHTYRYQSTSANVSGSWPGPYTVTEYQTTRNYNAAGLMINFGKQWVLGNIFCIDVYGGVGMVIGSKSISETVTDTYTTNSYPYNNYGYGYEIDFDLGRGFVGRYISQPAFSAAGGLKIGMLIGGNTAPVRKSAK